MVRVFNQRGEHRCRAEVSRRARPGVVHGLGIWWRKLGCDGTNVNQLTSQRPDRHRPRAHLLRLPGRGRSRRDAGRRAHEARRAVAGRVLRAGRSALLAGCADLGYYWQSASGHLGADARGAAGAGVARRPGHVRRAQGQAGADAAHPPLRGGRARPAGQPELHRPTPTCTGNGRAVERGGRARAFAHPQDLVLPGGGLRRLSRLLRRGGRQRGSRHPERRKAWRRPSTRCRPTRRWAG